MTKVKDIDFLMERINEWLEKTEYYHSAQTTKRYRYYLKRLFTEKPLLTKEIVSSIVEHRDLNVDIVVNGIVDWIFRAHKTMLSCYYAFMIFLRTQFTKDQIATLKDLIRLKVPENRSGRVLTDFKKIDAILKMLPEPMDVIARIQWETACRAGAALSLIFQIPEDTQNWLSIIGLMGKYQIPRGENKNSFYEMPPTKKGAESKYFIELHEKGGKVIQRAITKNTFEWIKNYVAYRKEQMYSFLETALRGKNKESFIKRIFCNRVFNIRICWYDTVLQNTGRAVGLEKFSSHWFRATRLRHLLEHNINVKDIQMFAGHKRFDTTSRYIDVPIAGKEEMFLKTLEEEK